MASVRGISHCYERPTYADWPYSVFTMAHGRSKEECDAILQSIADEHDLHGEDRAVLYSSTEFKKIRLHYFTEDYARWKRRVRSRRHSYVGGPLRAPPGSCRAESNSPVQAMSRSAGTTRSSSSGARASS